MLKQVELSQPWDPWPAYEHFPKFGLRCTTLRIIYTIPKLANWSASLGESERSDSLLEWPKPFPRNWKQYTSTFMAWIFRWGAKFEPQNHHQKQCSGRKSFYHPKQNNHLLSSNLHRALHRAGYLQINLAPHSQPPNHLASLVTA